MAMTLRKAVNRLVNDFGVAFQVSGRRPGSLVAMQRALQEFSTNAHPVMDQDLAPAPVKSKKKSASKKKVASATETE